MLLVPVDRVESRWVMDFHILPDFFVSHCSVIMNSLAAGDRHHESIHDHLQRVASGRENLPHSPFAAVDLRSACGLPG